MKTELDPKQVSKLVIKGYKSIFNCELSLGSINILLGANGTGKSNLISFFKMIREMCERNLQIYVSKQGGPDSFLYYGRKNTARIESKIYFGDKGYSFALEPTVDNKLVYSEESFWCKMSGERPLGKGHFESEAKTGTKTGIDEFVLPAIKQWLVYHFHDTSETAHVKQKQLINDNAYLRSDARNLAAYLLYLQQQYPDHYEILVQTIQLVAPFFGGFFLRPSQGNKEYIELEWTEKGQNIPFKAHYLSDGTLRFICLATVFLQPEELQPATILIDEPELGLHPYAIKLLAALMKSTAKKKQLILATQSVEFINEFQHEDILVVDRDEGKSTFKRLKIESLKHWLEEYSLGELWMKNIFGGRP